MAKVVPLKCKYSFIEPITGDIGCNNPELVGDAKGDRLLCSYPNSEAGYSQYFCEKFEIITQKTDNDNVNHPNHYCQGGIECIKAIEASMPADGFQDYCKGNVLKYIWRWRDKAGVEDLKKARVYLNWMIESADKEKTQ